MSNFKSISVERFQKPSENVLDLNCRLDGRQADKLRPVYLKSGVITNADGSAYIEVGNTKLICTVHGPHEISRSSDLPTADFGSKLLFVGKFHFAPFATKIRIRRKKKDDLTTEEQNFGRALTDAFLPAIRLDQYPKSQIDVFVNVLEDDGAVLAASLTCCSVALVNAGIEMYDIVIGASLRVLNEQFCIDPISSEEFKPGNIGDEKSDGNVTLGLMTSLNQVALIHQNGEFKYQTFSRAIKALTESCYRLYPVVQETIVKAFRAKSKIL